MQNERRIQSYVYIVDHTISSQIKDSKETLSLLSQTKAILPKAFPSCGFVPCKHNKKMYLLLKAEICFLGAHSFDAYNK